MGVLHDFSSHFQCCCYFRSKLFKGAKTFFYSGDLGGEVDWGNELGLKAIPYCEW